MAFRLKTLLMTVAFLVPTLASDDAGAMPIMSTHYASDAGFSTFLANRGVNPLLDAVVMAQARTSSNPRTGDYEVGLHVPPDLLATGPLGIGRQFRWGADGRQHAWVPFTLARIADTLEFTMGAYTGSYVGLEVFGINALSLRVNSTGPGTSTTLRNLAVDGDALAGGMMRAANGAVELALIEGLVDDFVISGDARLNWHYGSLAPGGAWLGFQLNALVAPFNPDTVVVVHNFEVSEPSTAWLLLAGSLGLAGLRRCNLTRRSPIGGGDQKCARLRRGW